MCDAVDKLSHSVGELPLPGASLAKIRNQLGALCGQRQVEPRADIKLTLLSVETHRSIY